MRQTARTCALLLLLALLRVDSRLSSQGVPGAGGAPVCNDLSRTLQQPAGVSGQVVITDCAQITVSVGGSSYSTPPTCVVAYSQYCDSVYTCGPAAEGIHCDPRGYKAAIKNYRNGRCPDIAGLANGMFWEEWADVPANLVAIIQAMSSCVLPEVSETFDWSASTTACSQGEVVEPGVQGDASGVRRTSGSGDPRALVEGCPFRNPFETPYGVAMRAGGGVAEPLLQEVETHHPPLHGAALSVALEVRHYEAGSLEARHVSALLYDGRIAASGTFDLVRTSILYGEETLLGRERQLFDGIFLAFATLGAPEGRVLGPRHQEESPVWSVEILPYLQPLHRWLENPFDLSRFASHRYSVAPQGAGGERILLEKSVQAGPRAYVDRRLLLERPSRSGGAGPRCVRESWILDASGEVREKSSFGDFREVAPGVWRPFRIEHTVFLGVRPRGARIEWRFRIDSAMPLTREQAEQIPHATLDGPDAWLVWP